MRFGGRPSLRRAIRPSPGPAGEVIRSISRPVNTFAYLPYPYSDASRGSDRLMPVARTTAETATREVRGFSSRSMASVGQASAHFRQPSHQGPFSTAYASGTHRSAGR